MITDPVSYVSPGVRKISSILLKFINFNFSMDK